MMWGPFKAVDVMVFDPGKQMLKHREVSEMIMLGPEDANIDDIYCRDYEHIDASNPAGNGYELIKHDIKTDGYKHDGSRPTVMFIEDIGYRTKTLTELTLEDGHTAIIHAYYTIDYYEGKVFNVKNGRKTKLAKVVKAKKVKLLVPEARNGNEISQAIQYNIPICKPSEYAAYLESKLPMLEDFEGLVDMFRSNDRDTRNLAETILKSHNLDKFKLSVSYLCRDRSTFLEDMLCKYDMRSYSKMPKYFDQCDPEDVDMVKKLMYETAKSDLDKLIKRWGEVVEFDMRMKA